MLACTDEEQMKECNATASPYKSASKTGDSDTNSSSSLSDDSDSDTLHNKDSSFDENNVLYWMNHRTFHVSLTVKSSFDFNSFFL